MSQQCSTGIPEDGQVQNVPLMELSDDVSIGDYAQAVTKAGEGVVSVIVPCANDRKWLPGCFERLIRAFQGTTLTYEVIVVDNHSHDESVAYVRSMKDALPVRVIENQHAVGRSMSIKQGLDQSVGGSIVLLDPDLRFPEGSFVAMLHALDRAEIVVANRSTYPFLVYKIFSRLYRWIFGHLFLSVDADIRSGLKMFRRSLIDSIRFNPLFHARIGFDAFLLFHAKRAGWSIQALSVEYTRPLFHHGVWGSIASRFSLAAGVISLTLSRAARVLFPFLYPPQPQEYFEAGFVNVNDYLFLDPAQSAKGHLTKEVYLLLAYLFTGMIIWFSLIEFAIDRSFAWSLFFHIAVIQFILIMFKLYVVWETFRLPPQPPRMLVPEEMHDLPVISVICPVYKEKEVIPQLCTRMAEMEYPIDKIDLIFIFESGDDETIQAFLDYRPPSHFRGLVSPDVLPKTKPKALNVALKETKGELLVIFDAETLPETDQFLKVVAALRHNPELDYVHCRIDVYNPMINWITKMYTAEFAFFYGYFLPGLATILSPTPISGHSVYFRREQLIKIGGWDAYNLAEDCDIGIRMFRHGYKRASVLDSYSWEQSTTTFSAWIKQRTRWMQGFVQTSMVNLRYPTLLWRDLGGIRNMLMFMFHVPGGVFLNGLNFIQWCMLLFWFTTNDPIIQTIFTDVLLYISVLSFFLANILFTYFNLLGLFSRKYYSIVPIAMTSILYWLLLSFATARAILRFLRQESTWDKTSHSSIQVHPTQL